MINKIRHMAAKASELIGRLIVEADRLLEAGKVRNVEKVVKQSSALRTHRSWVERAGDVYAEMERLSSLHAAAMDDLGEQVKRKRFTLTSRYVPRDQPITWLQGIVKGLPSVIRGVQHWGESGIVDLDVTDHLRVCSGWSRASSSGGLDWEPEKYTSQGTLASKLFDVALRSGYNPDNWMVECDRHPAWIDTDGNPVFEIMNIDSHSRYLCRLVMTDMIVDGEMKRVVTKAERVATNRQLTADGYAKQNMWKEAFKSALIARDLLSVPNPEYRRANVVACMDHYLGDAKKDMVEAAKNRHKREEDARLALEASAKQAQEDYEWAINFMSGRTKEEV